MHLRKRQHCLENASRECAEIIERDRAVEAPRAGAAFLLALRPWQYSGFAEFLRE